MMSCSSRRGRPAQRGDSSSSVYAWVPPGGSPAPGALRERVRDDAAVRVGRRREEPEPVRHEHPAVGDGDTTAEIATGVLDHRMAPVAASSPYTVPSTVGWKTTPFA